MRAKKRHLNAKQQVAAAQAVAFVRPAVASFLKRNPDLRSLAQTLYLESVANTAVCMAAMTFDPSKSLPQTYFGSAISHALYKEVLAAQKIASRYIASEDIRSPVPNSHRTRLESRAMRALRLLSAYDRTLLEDRLIERVTLEQLSLEQGCDPRTIAKRIREAIDKLRAIEQDLP